MLRIQTMNITMMTTAATVNRMRIAVEIKIETKNETTEIDRIVIVYLHDSNVAVKCNRNNLAMRCRHSGVAIWTPHPDGIIIIIIIIRTEFSTHIKIVIKTVVKIITNKIASKPASQHMFITWNDLHLIQDETM